MKYATEFKQTSHCDIHATLKQRLNAIKLLSGAHKITTLCRVLHVNRSSYYKFINHKPSNREKENQHIRTLIVELYARSDKRLGCGKMAQLLGNEYRINISRARVYRLMKAMNLPKMSTIKPVKSKKSKESEGECRNILA